MLTSKSIENSIEKDIEIKEYAVPIGTSEGVLAILAKTFSVLGQVGNSKTRETCDHILNKVRIGIVEREDKRGYTKKEDVAPESVVGQCVAAKDTDKTKPVLAGQKARQEIRTVLISPNDDLVVTSMGEVELPKNCGVIRTPINNIVIPVVKPRVADPLREILRVGFPSDEVDAELVSFVFGEDYDQMMEDRQNKPVKRDLTYFTSRVGVLDLCCDLLEQEYPKYRDKPDVTDGYYHPLDPGRWNRSDHEMHTRDGALMRIIKQVRTAGPKVKPRVGIITSNDEHYIRACRLFGKNNVFYPMSEAEVDIVLYHPYERAIAFDPGVDPADVARNKIEKHAPMWVDVKNWVIPYNNVKVEAPLNSARNYGLYGFALHRPRFYVASFNVANTTLPDVVLMQSPNNFKRKVKNAIYAKNAGYIAFMLAVSASRNFKLTPRSEIQVSQEWERRGGRLPLKRIFKNRHFLEREVYITGRRKVGTSRGILASDTDMMLEMQLISTEFGDKFFTKESLLALDLDWPVLQRMVMKGFLIPAKSQGLIYYRVATPSTSVEWDVEAYPPAIVYGEGVIAYPADRPITTILPVPTTMKELLNAAFKRHDTVPLRRRVFSGGGEEGHVVDSNV